MRLRNPTIVCGGENGCGLVLQFELDETVEDARVALARHRESTNHPAQVEHARELRDWEKKNRRRESILSKIESDPLWLYREASE